MVTIDGDTLTIKDLLFVCKKFEPVGLCQKACQKIQDSRKIVEDILEQERIVYGITTGFGELANTYISPRQSRQLQENLIRSHAVGVGEPLSEEVVRGIILLRANALAKGFSGVRQELIEFLVQLLNLRIYPYVPAQGSVGSSGDLAPLAHLALVVTGEGECFREGKRIGALKELQTKGLKPLKLHSKEGLAMINGTQVMAALGCLAVAEAELLLKNAQIAGSMSLEALKGTARAFDAKIHRVRPFTGQLKIAENMSKLVAGSQIIESHKDCEKIQDAYTLRCIPQVYGAIYDTIVFIKNTLSIEINSATDNPLIFAEQKEVISGGNFHGEPLAFAMDFLAIVMAEIANISERTIDRLVNPHVSGLPPFLSARSGLNSGFMIAQYTAASLVSENKGLAHPASVDSIPTSAGQEDHVSMGTIAARKVTKILKNVEYVLAIEMLCAAQGLEFQEYSPGRGTQLAHSCIRERVPKLDQDRILYPDIEAVREIIVDGTIVRAVEDQLGDL